MTETVIMSLAEKLRELREAAQLSQQDLAVAAGMSVSIVAKIEQGVNTDPRLNTVKALARALNVSADVLIELDRPEEPTKPRRRKGGS
jgi:transcriptional regulator with XRE-family HTH domain